MQLDRHEQYVLRALEEKHGITTGKIESLVDHRQLSAVYEMGYGGYTCCRLYLNGTLTGYGDSVCHPHKEEKSVERIGRMIAFARAVLAVLEIPALSGEQLEALARGDGVMYPQKTRDGDVAVWNPGSVIGTSVGP